MKTPRQLLLERHRAAEDRLNAIRRRIITEHLSLANRENSPVANVSRLSRHDRLNARMSVVLNDWLEAFKPLRLHIAGLVALWIVITAMKVSTPSVGPTRAAQTAAPSREQLLALAERRRLMAELIDSPAPQPTESPKPFTPRPRGERRMDTAAV